MPVIQRYAQEYGIPEYVQVIRAIMMQEYGGQGTDPMQASECPYNTQYFHSPGGITDPDHVGIVEKCENGRVYTVEGNSGDVVKQREYVIGSRVILGYGV